MSSNNENSRDNNDQPPPDYDAGGDVLAPRTNLPSLNTNQPWKPATASAGGSVQADSGYRTGSTSGTTPAFPSPSSAVVQTASASSSAIETTSTPTSASTSESASIPSATIPRGHARNGAQDLGMPPAARKSSAKLVSIAEHEPTSSTTGHGREAHDDSVFDDIDMTKEINFTPVDTTSLRLGQQPAVTAERHGTSPISPKTTTNPLKAHPIQSQGGQILEGPGPHIPKHREHQGSATSGILRSQNSLAKLDTTMDTTGTKRPTFDDAAINKPRSDKAYPTTPYEKEKEGSKLKLKQKPLKVGMGQPIKQLAVKIRGKITGKDERAREAQLKARQASADAKALHEEVTGAPTGMSKMLQKVKSISILRKHDDDEPVANTREASATAVENARRTRSQWWPDWRQKSSKHSADLSDDDAKSRQRKIHQALQSFALQARGSTTAKKPFNSIDYARDYPDRPWDVPKSSGPVGHRTAEEMYYHPDMRPGDDLSEKFYVSGSTLTPLLLDEKGRPIRFAGHSSESSTATNWARGTVSKVEDIAGRTLMKVSGRKVKSEADALDNTTVERVSSWRARSRLVDANPPLNTLVEVASSESAVPPVDYSHMNGTAIQERPRQPSGIHEIPADEASEQQLSLTRFPSMPTEASSPSTVYEQSVHTCHSALAPNSQPSSVPALQAPSVPVHPIIAGGAVQPMSDISQAPPVPLQEPAPQRTANALTVPQTAGSTLLAVRGASSPSSTATDNVPSLIPDESSAGSASTSS